VHDAFLALAVEVGLIDARGYWAGPDRATAVARHVRRHGAEELVHVVTWALRGWNPFEEGPLK
jgi:hypothetical protein